MGQGPIGPPFPVGQAVNIAVYGSKAIVDGVSSSQPTRFKANPRSVRCWLPTTASRAGVTTLAWAVGIFKGGFAGMGNGFGCNTWTATGAVPPYASMTARPSTPGSWEHLQSQKLAGVQVAGNEAGVY